MARRISFWFMVTPHHGVEHVIGDGFGLACQLGLEVGQADDAHQAVELGLLLAPVPTLNLQLEFHLSESDLGVAAALVAVGAEGGVRYGGGRGELGVATWAGAKV